MIRVLTRGSVAEGQALRWRQPELAFDHAHLLAEPLNATVFPSVRWGF